MASHPKRTVFHVAPVWEENVAAPVTDAAKPQRNDNRWSTCFEIQNARLPK
jgi:hypothetical protein